MRRKVDGQGRICLPAFSRGELNFTEGSYVEIEPVKNGLLITIPIDRCIACDSIVTEGYKISDDSPVVLCDDCYNKLHKFENSDIEEVEDE